MELSRICHRGMSLGLRIKRDSRFQLIIVVMGSKVMLFIVHRMMEVFRFGMLEQIFYIVRKYKL